MPFTTYKSSIPVGVLPYESLFDQTPVEAPTPKVEPPKPAPNGPSFGAAISNLGKGLLEGAVTDNIAAIPEALSIGSEALTGSPIPGVESTAEGARSFTEPTAADSYGMNFMHQVGRGLGSLATIYLPTKWAMLAKLGKAGVTIEQIAAKAPEALAAIQEATALGKKVAAGASLYGGLQEGIGAAKQAEQKGAEGPGQLGALTAATAFSAGTQMFPLMKALNALPDQARSYVGKVLSTAFLEGSQETLEEGVQAIVSDIAAGKAPDGTAAVWDMVKALPVTMTVGLLGAAVVQSGQVVPENAGDPDLTPEDEAEVARRQEELKAKLFTDEGLASVRPAVQTGLDGMPMEDTGFVATGATPAFTGQAEGQVIFQKTMEERQARLEAARADEKERQRIRLEEARAFNESVRGQAQEALKPKNFTGAGGQVEMAEAVPWSKARPELEGDVGAAIKMLAEGEDVGDVFELLTHDKGLSVEELGALRELVDEVGPVEAFTVLRENVLRAQEVSPAVETQTDAQGVVQEVQEASGVQAEGERPKFSDSVRSEGATQLDMPLDRVIGLYLGEVRGMGLQDDALTVRAFADRIAKGEKLTSPEDLQYYQNNAEAVEAELRAKAQKGSQTSIGGATSSFSPNAGGPLGKFTKPTLTPAQRREVKDLLKKRSEIKRQMVEVRKLPKNDPNKTGKKVSNQKEIRLGELEAQLREVERKLGPNLPVRQESEKANETLDAFRKEVRQSGVGYAQKGQGITREDIGNLPPGYYRKEGRTADQWLQTAIGMGLLPEGTTEPSALAGLLTGSNLAKPNTEIEEGWRANAARKQATQATPADPVEAQLGLLAYPAQLEQAQAALEQAKESGNREDLIAAVQTLNRLVEGLGGMPVETQKQVSEVLGGAPAKAEFLDLSKDGRLSQVKVLTGGGGVRTGFVQENVFSEEELQAAGEALEVYKLRVVKLPEGATLTGAGELYRLPVVKEIILEVEEDLLFSKVGPQKSMTQAVNRFFKSSGLQKFSGFAKDVQDLIALGEDSFMPWQKAGLQLLKDQGVLREFVFTEDRNQVAVYPADDSTAGVRYASWAVAELMDRMRKGYAAAVGGQGFGEEVVDMASLSQLTAGQLTAAMNKSKVVGRGGTLRKALEQVRQRVEEVKRAEGSQAPAITAAQTEDFLRIFFAVSYAAAVEQGVPVDSVMEQALYNNDNPSPELRAFLNGQTQLTGVTFSPTGMAGVGNRVVRAPWLGPREKVLASQGPSRQAWLRETELTLPNGQVLKTGTPASLMMAPRGRVASRAMVAGDLEPIGDYFKVADSGTQTERVAFANPLVIPFSSKGRLTYTGMDNWKARLAETFNGQAGEDLAKILGGMGHDGIVVVRTEADGRVVGVKEAMRLPEGLVGVPEVSEIERLGGVERAQATESGPAVDVPMPGQLELFSQQSGLIKAYVELLQGGKNLVYLTKNSDIRDVFHEFVGHVTRRAFLGTRKMKEPLAKWSGAVQQADGTWLWPRDAEEKFVEGLISLVADPAFVKTLPGSVQSSFTRMANYFKALDKVWGTKPQFMPSQIDPRTREAFASLFVTPKEKFVETSYAKMLHVRIMKSRQTGRYNTSFLDETQSRALTMELVAEYVEEFGPEAAPGDYASIKQRSDEILADKTRLEGVIERMRSGAIVQAEEQLAIRKLIATLNQEMGNKYLFDYTKPFAERMRLFEQAKNNPVELVVELTGLDLRQGTMLSHAMRARRIEVSMQEAMAAAAKFLNTPYLNSSDQNLLKSFMEGLNDSNVPAETKLAQADEIIKKFKNTSGKDMFKALMINWMLSNPATQAINFMSNIMRYTWFGGNMALTAGIDAVLSGVGLKAREVYLSDAMAFVSKETRKRAWDQGARDAWDIIKTGTHAKHENTKLEQDLSASEQLAIEHWYSEKHPLLSSWVRKFSRELALPTRLMRAADHFTFSYGYFANLQVYASRQARKEGLKPGSAEFRVRVQNLLQNPPKEMSFEAQRAAKHINFTDEPGKIIQGVLSFKNGLGVASPFLLPFVTTIANIQKEGASFIPIVGLGIEYMRAQQEITKGPFRGQKAVYTPPMSALVAKQLQGAFLVWLLLSMFEGRDEDGLPKLTGRLPTSPAKRDFWLQNNILPYSIKLGSTYVQFSQMDPFSSLFMGVADAYDAYRQYKEGELNSKEDPANAAFNLALNNIFMGQVNKSFVDQFIKIFDPNTSVIANVSEKMTALVPWNGFLRFLAKITDSDDFRPDAPKALLPWLKVFPLPGIPGKLTPLGEPQTVPSQTFFNAWSPLKAAQPEMTEVDKAFMRWGMFPGMPLPDKRITLVSGSNEEYQIPDDLYRKFLQDYGSVAVPRLENFVNSAGYRATKLTDVQGQMRLLKRADKILTDSRQQALRRLKAEMRGLVRAGAAKPIPKQSLPQVGLSDQTALGGVS